MINFDPNIIIISLSLTLNSYKCMLDNVVLELRVDLYLLTYGKVADLD